LKQHHQGALAGRWNQFSWFGLKYVTKKGALSKGAASRAIVTNVALNHLEAVLVSVAEPALNRQGGRWGQMAKQYFQVRAPELGKSSEEILRDLHRKASIGAGARSERA